MIVSWEFNVIMIRFDRDVFLYGQAAPSAGYRQYSNLDQSDLEKQKTRFHWDTGDRSWMGR